MPSNIPTKLPTTGILFFSVTYKLTDKIAIIIRKNINLATFFFIYILLLGPSAWMNTSAIPYTR